MEGVQTPHLELNLNPLDFCCMQISVNDSRDTKTLGYIKLGGHVVPLSS